MTNYQGSGEATATLVSGFTGRVAAVFALSNPAPVTLSVDTPDALDPGAVIKGIYSATAPSSGVSATNYLGVLGEFTTPAIDWFERFHILARSYDFGHVLTTTSATLEVFSAFRHATHLWNTYVNNAGDGVTLVDQPSLPVAVLALEGIVMTLTIDTDGPATVDTTLDFSFDSGDISIPIVFDRLILWSMPPEMPYVEELEFLTEVMEKKDGSEQRIALRANPRQAFEQDFLLDDGAERARLDNLLFDWQARQFGIPIWHEETPLLTAVIAGGLVLSVGSTAYGDFRDASLVLVYQDQTTFDILEIESHTTSTITLASGLVNPYSAGARVMPLRVGYVSPRVQGAIYPVNLSSMRLRFTVTDNEAGIASTAGFSTFNSKVLFDDSNGISGTMTESLDRNVIILDNGTGIPINASTQTRGKRTSLKTFLCSTAAGAWAARQVLHSLRGRQVSFYLPTFRKDLVITDALVNGAITINVTNVGYTNLVQSRTPRNVIRVVFNDGTASLLRSVVSSTVLSTTKETLTVNTPWPANKATSTVRRIEYVEKVRFDSDTIRILHEKGGRTTKIQAPVRTVFE